MVLVQRGSCSFTAKALALKAAGALAMLLYDDQPGCIAMGFALNETELVGSLTSLAAVSISLESGLKLKALLESQSEAKWEASVQVLASCSKKDAGESRSFTRMTASIISDKDVINSQMMNRLQ